ncbi:hypothetical protein H0486_03695 [Lachnospiraceae bacterium MD1]|jgi:hypothetical protein|uniref:Uncharacterized protein n=1 Tax=Variimorphobacter saccharofermentans TaxID=2755051 RepID=A0A839JXN0_9FIRM|nr:hypothetical protein [Variimorphobacter saccharofermentans]MBB2181977.1 hypothetical protein [Variimorphobacter saccharofermentans]
MEETLLENTPKNPRNIKQYGLACIMIIVLLLCFLTAISWLHPRYYYDLRQGFVDAAHAKPIYYLKKSVSVDPNTNLTLDFLVVYDDSVYLLASSDPSQTFSIRYGNIQNETTSDNPETNWSMQFVDNDIQIENNQIELTINEIPVLLKLDPVPAYSELDYRRMKRSQFNELEIVQIPLENDRYYVYGLSFTSDKYPNTDFQVGITQQTIKNTNQSLLQYKQYQNLYLIPREEQGPFHITSDYYWAYRSYNDPSDETSEQSEQDRERVRILLPSENMTLEKKQQFTLYDYSVIVHKVTRDKNNIIIDYTVSSENNDKIYLYLNPIDPLPFNGSLPEGETFRLEINTEEYYEEDTLALTMNSVGILVECKDILLELPVD